MESIPMNEAKADLSPRRRFLAGLLGGRKGRRISVANPTSIISIELMDKVGIHFPEAHLDPRQMAELAAGGYEPPGRGISFAGCGGRPQRLQSALPSACARSHQEWKADSY